MATEEASPSMTMKMVMGTIKKKWPNIKNMSTVDLTDYISQQHAGANLSEGQSTTATPDGPLLLLDTRPKEEFDVSHLEGAVMVDPNGADVADTVKLIKDGTKSTVVCYCSIGYRSSGYAQSLQSSLTAEGLEAAVYNLEGSLMKWANEGRPMVDNQGAPTVYCHPYNALWGKLLRSDLRRTNPSTQ